MKALASAASGDKLLPDEDRSATVIVPLSGLDFFADALASVAASDTDREADASAAMASVRLGRTQLVIGTSTPLSFACHPEAGGTSRPYLQDRRGLAAMRPGPRFCARGQQSADAALLVIDRRGTRLAL